MKVMVLMVIKMMEMGLLIDCGLYVGIGSHLHWIGGDSVAYLVLALLCGMSSGSWPW